jgi:hypothetical protein
MDNVSQTSFKTTQLAILKVTDSFSHAILAREV